MIERLCTVDGCGKPHAAHGWCVMHWARYRRHGDVMTVKQAPDGAGRILRGYHTRKISGKERRVHVMVAEVALGKPLPRRALVHHANGIKHDNRNENLVICPNDAYHKLLHTRMAAIDTCGNPDWRKCIFCKRYDDLSNLKSQPIKGMNESRHFHNECRLLYMKERRQLTRQSERVSV